MAVLESRYGDHDHLPHAPNSKGSSREWLDLKPETRKFKSVDDTYHFRRGTGGGLGLRLTTVIRESFGREYQADCISPEI